MAVGEQLSIDGIESELSRLGYTLELGDIALALTETAEV